MGLSFRVWTLVERLFATSFNTLHPILALMGLHPRLISDAPAGLRGNGIREFLTFQTASKRERSRRSGAAQGLESPLFSAVGTQGRRVVTLRSRGRLWNGSIARSFADQSLSSSSSFFSPAFLPTT